MMHFIHKTNSGLLLPDQFGLAPHASYPCAQAYHSNTAMVRAEDLEMAAHASMGAPFPGFSSQPIMSLQEIEALLSSSSTASLLPTPSSDNLGGALDDLAARFILNCPSEPDELQGNDEMMLLMFEVEKAWWFYIDLMMPADASLPALPHRAFAARLFAHCSLLHHVANVDAIFTEWQHYKRTIPTLGAAILSTNLDKVLLVRGFKGSSWGWPKGKVNKDEPDAVCAAREVFEEIGYDITPLLCEHSSIFVTTAGQKMKLYVIAGVDESTPFETQTRGEIAEIRWHSLKDVTAAARPDAASKSKYFGVAPVLGKVKAWIADRKRSLSRSQTPKRAGAKAAGEKAAQGEKGSAGQLARPDNFRACANKAQGKGEAEKAGGGAGGRKGRGSPQRLKAMEVDAAGVGRDNTETFGDMFASTAAKGFSCEEMFAVNAAKFGIESTYSFEQYTTKLPGSRGDEGAGKRGMMYADRYRPCKVPDALVVDVKPDGSVVQRDVMTPVKTPVKTPDAAVKKGRKAGGKPGTPGVGRAAGQENVAPGVAPGVVPKKAAAVAGAGSARRVGRGAGEGAAVDAAAGLGRGAGAEEAVDASAGLLTPAMLSFAFNRDAIVGAMAF